LAIESKDDEVGDERRMQTGPRRGCRQTVIRTALTGKIMNGAGVWTFASFQNCLNAGQGHVAAGGVDIENC